MKKVILRGYDGPLGIDHAEYSWEPFTDEAEPSEYGTFNIPDGLCDWWSSADTDQRLSAMRAEIKQMVMERAPGKFHRISYTVPDASVDPAFR